MRSILMTGLFVAVSIVGFAEEEVAGMNNSNQMMYADCGKLSQREQDFSMKLSDTNQRMFCQQFNSTQRANAMDMAYRRDNTGNMMMTPDQAVSKVAKDNNIAPQPGGRRGGCGMQ